MHKAAALISATLALLTTSAAIVPAQAAGVRAEKVVVRTVDKKGNFLSVHIPGGFWEFRIIPQTRFVKKGAAKPPTLADIRPGDVVTVIPADADGAASVEMIAQAPLKEAAGAIEDSFTGLVKETDPARGTLSIADDWRDTLYEFELAKDVRVVKGSEPKAVLGAADIKKGMKIAIRARNGRARLIEIQSAASDRGTK